MKNSIFIGTSIDGYIADRNGGLEWLDAIPLPEGEDMGYFKFMESIDALVMGRATFETVLGFDVDWPYDKPVFVLSNKLTEIPEIYRDKAFLVSGPLKKVLKHIHRKGFDRLYIDGGRTIQSFLNEDLVDEMIITTIPVLLGGGFPLFGDLPKESVFRCLDTKVFAKDIVQRHYRRTRELADS